MTACPDCGGALRSARRYESARTVSVRICWECGWDTPALYRRSAIGRNTGFPLLATVPCPRCGTPFESVDWPSARRTYCSQLCANRDTAERSPDARLVRRLKEAV